jgi:hypothetical protein
MPDPNTTVPAGNTGNLIMNMLFGQQNDPAQQMSDWANTQQARNRVAIGTDLQGNLLPSPAPGTPPGVGSGQITGAPQDPTAAMAAVQQTGVLPPGQTPNATKSDQSLGSMIIALQRRDEAAAGLQQSLALAGAAISRPENRERAFRALSPGAPINAMGLGQGLMNLASQQQGQDRMNAIGQMIMDPQRGPALAASLNIGSWDQLKAAFQADPASIGKMIQDYNQQTQPVKGVEQITNLQGKLKASGANDSEVNLLTPSLIAAVGPDFAQKAIQDAGSYRASHNGQPAPWVGPNGVNVAAYDQWSSTQRAIKANQIDTASTAASSLASTNTLRQKLSDLRNDADLTRVLSLPSDTAEKVAFQAALDDQSNDWKKNVATVVLTDPGAMRVLSELKEINGKEYRGAIESILGHGLRPSQTEVTAVRSGFGQTNRVLNFGSMKDYQAQAIDPLLTYVDEAQAKLYGDRGDIENAPDRVKPFFDPSYLTGGSMHLDDGKAPLDWEKNVNKPMPPELAAAAQARMEKEPKNAFAIRDQLRRQGYRVEF